MAVRMEMHATDPANLELRLGRWDSEGCIRIPSTFNKFLDNQGLIDEKLREIASTDRRFAALLPRATPNPLAGSVLVVVDTSDPDAPRPIRSRPTRWNTRTCPGRSTTARISGQGCRISVAGSPPQDGPASRCVQAWVTPLAPC